MTTGPGPGLYVGRVSLAAAAAAAAARCSRLAFSSSRKTSASICARTAGRSGDFFSWGRFLTFPTEWETCDFRLLAHCGWVSRQRFWSPAGASASGYFSLRTSRWRSSSPAHQIAADRWLAVSTMPWVRQATPKAPLLPGLRSRNLISRSPTTTHCARMPSACRAMLSSACLRSLHKRSSIDWTLVCASAAIALSPKEKSGATCAAPPGRLVSGSREFLPRRVGRVRQMLGGAGDLLGAASHHPAFRHRHRPDHHAELALRGDRVGWFAMRLDVDLGEAERCFVAREVRDLEFVEPLDDAGFRPFVPQQEPGHLGGSLALQQRVAGVLDRRPADLQGPRQQCVIGDDLLGDVGLGMEAGRGHAGALLVRPEGLQQRFFFLGVDDTAQGGDIGPGSWLPAVERRDVGFRHAEIDRHAERDARICLRAQAVGAVGDAAVIAIIGIALRVGPPFALPHETRQNFGPLGPPAPVEGVVLEERNRGHPRRDRHKVEHRLIGSINRAPGEFINRLTIKLGGGFGYSLNVRNDPLADRQGPVRLLKQLCRCHAVLLPSSCRYGRHRLP